MNSITSELPSVPAQIEISGDPHEKISPIFNDQLPQEQSEEVVCNSKSKKQSFLSRGRASEANPIQSQKRSPLRHSM